MAPRPTILQVLPRLATGGAERGAVEVAAAAAQAGWKSIVASAGGQMAREITDSGAVHLTLPLASKNPAIMMQNVRSLVQVIRDHGVDIVHARSRAPAWSAWIAARRCGRPFVTTFHNAYGASTALKRKYNSVMAKGVRVIAISDFVAAYAERVYDVPKQKLRIIPRGVDVEKFDAAHIEPARIEKLRDAWNVRQGRTVVLLPGRLTRWKGQLVFIDAVARMKRRDAIFLIVGSGENRYREELEQAIRRHGLENAVRLTGECRDMPAAFGIAGVAISASTRPEGFGRVIVEAQAMGCAVIAANHGGAAETVIDGETGFLVPPGNADKLAETLDKVLSLPAPERKRICERSFAYVRESFTARLMTERTLEVYEEVLHRT